MITRRTGLTYSQIHKLNEHLPPESESSFQAAIIDLARLCHWKRIYHPWSSMHSAQGFPDLTLCKPPRLLFAEIKTTKGRVTSAQTGWLDDLSSCPGVEVYFCQRHNEWGIWRPADWDDIVAILQGKVPR